MAKVLKFDSQSPLTKKSKSETNKLQGEVIEFPRQQLSFENAALEETNETNPPTVFFGCF